MSLSSPALTQTPDIQVQGTLESGRPGTITCAPPAACEWGTPPTFSWTRAALRSLGSQLPRSSALTFTPGPGDHGTDLTCRVTFPGAGAGVSSQSTIRLNVSCECWATMGGPEAVGRGQWGGGPRATGC